MPKQTNLMPLTLTLAAATLVLIGAGCQRYAAPTTEKTAQPATTAQELTVNLGEQNNSGQTGQVVLTALDGQTMVALSLSNGLVEVMQPVHIHANNCATIGGVKYPLTNVLNGESVTLLDVSLDELLAQRPLSINAHKSLNEIGAYVACGDFPTAE